ncbi:hypothetical protein DDI_2817 [Dickeya dianthicola RNS04.9]|nr:hypothetical protein DDI_2817 [Dickeya dianthicola RNS04.9]
MLQQSFTGKGGKETLAAVDLENQSASQNADDKNNRQALSTSISQLG